MAMEKNEGESSLTQKILNKKVLKNVGENRTVLLTIKIRKRKQLQDWVHKDCTLMDVNDGMVEDDDEKGEKMNPTP